MYLVQKAIILLNTQLVITLIFLKVNFATCHHHHHLSRSCHCWQMASTTWLWGWTKKPTTLVQGGLVGSPVVTQGWQPGYAAGCMGYILPIAGPKQNLWPDLTLAITMKFHTFAGHSFEHIFHIAKHWLFFLRKVDMGYANYAAYTMASECDKLYKIIK